MIKFPTNLTPEEADALLDHFNEGWDRCEAFYNTFDSDLLLTLATDELNSRWQQFGFDAELVETASMPSDRPLWLTESEEFTFALMDDNGASKGKSAEQNRRELAEQLHEDLVERSYDEQSLVSAVAEAVIEHGGVEAEHEAIKHNYSNVRVAIVGCSPSEFGAATTLQVHDSADTVTVYSGRICLDLAIWMVPLD